MHYAIVRSRVRISLWLILLVAALVTAMPWLYENIFIHDEDFNIGWDQLVDFESLAPANIEIDKDNYLNLNFLNDDYVFSEFRVEDIELKGVIVSADMAVKGRIIRDEQGRSIGFSGKLFSRDVTLNSKRIPPLRMAFRIIRDELEIEALRLGRSYRLGGKISLVEPFNIDLRLEIERADMRRLSRASKIKGYDAAFGIVSGSFDIKGALSGNVFSKGFIESRNGRIGSVSYKAITLRLEGFGPIINIVDSNVSHDSGRLRMDGYMDLRNIAKGNLFEGVRIRSDMKTIMWDGWDITKDGIDRLSMKKDINEKIRIGFKTMAREPVITYYERENPEEMSLEYSIGMENLKMRLKDNEEFFGIEHRVKF